MRTLITCVIFMFCSLGCANPKEDYVLRIEPVSAKSRLIIYDEDCLKALKEQYLLGDAETVTAVKDMLHRLEPVLEAAPVTVVDKETNPPSGDEHDYMSLSIYWWPNPITKIPYIHKDGRRNPEADKYDGMKIRRMSRDVKTLALAYYLTDDEIYASKAACLLRAWFLDEDTYMNPNMNYAQGIPGLCKGARQGVIEAVPLATKVLDSVYLIQGSEAWSSRDHENLTNWFKEYLNWLLTSRMGKQERARKNNHGMWYDVQVAGYALFIGDEDLAKRILRESVPARLVVQIAPDGRQPHELCRTKSFDYSCYNLKAMFILAQLAKKQGIDLWNFKGPQGQGIPTALNYLCRYRDGKEQWPYQQILPVNIESMLARYVYIAHRQFSDSMCDESPNDVFGRYMCDF